MTFASRTVAALLLTLAAPRPAWAEPKFKKEAKKYSVAITTNVPGGNVFGNGFALGHSGDAFDAEPGIREFVVLANGYVPRKIYLKIDTRTPRVTRRVELLTAPRDNKDQGDIELDFAK